MTNPTPSPAAPAAGGRAPRRDLERVALALVGAWFVARVAFLAFNLHPFVPPDEVDWFGRATYFAQTWGIPDDSRESARYGAIARQPNLYFWLLGRVLALHPAPEQGLLLARLANLPLAVVALFSVWRLAGLLLTDPWARLLVVVAYSNTLQATHLFATVTYDNLAHALAAALLYQLFALLQRFEPRRLLALLLCAALAVLTKQTMLPLVALVAASLAVGRWRTATVDLRSTVAAVRARRPERALAVAALLAAGLAVELYGGNVLRFGKLQAYAVDVLPLEWALENRLARRDWIVIGYRAGELGYEQAVAEIARIPNAGNQRRARRLIEAVRAERLGRPAARVGPLAYAAVWIQLVRDRLFGFHGNGGFVLPPYWPLRLAILPLLAAALAVALVRWRREADGVLTAHALAIAIGYCLVLGALVNYPLYRIYGALDFAVNGRYVIPVLPLLLTVGARYLVAPLPRRTRAVAALALAALFVAGDVPHLAKSMRGCWLASAPPEARCTF